MSMRRAGFGPPSFLPLYAEVGVQVSLPISYDRNSASSPRLVAEVPEIMPETSAETQRPCSGFFTDFP